MVSVKEWKDDPALLVMGVAFRMQHSLSKDAGFDRRDRGFCVIVLVGDEHMFDIGRMVEQVHGRVPLTQGEPRDAAHRDLDHVPVGVATLEGPQAVSSKFGKEPKPAGYWRAREG